MKRKLSETIVVITGASSGIGRAAALEFAKKKATVALIARDSKSLKQAAKECAAEGAWTLDISADVTDEAAVRAAADRVVSECGRIDVWVNNAAVTAFGRIEETPYEEYRRVIETNLFGYIHGARAVMPYFRKQGHGILIQVSSFQGKVGSPYVSAYAASKFAVNGLAESLRMEVDDAPDIHVCTILSASMDTPLFQHASNHSGRAVKPLDPVYSPAKAAKKIVRLAMHPRAEVAVGNSGKAFLLMRAAFPRAAEKMLAQIVEKNHFQEQTARPKRGNLFSPMDNWNRISGGWREKSSVNLNKTAVVLMPAAILLGAASAWGIKKYKNRKSEAALEPVEDITAQDRAA